MDYQFIENMVDAYFIDNNIYENNETGITKTFFSNDLLNTMRDLRENDLETYDFVYNLSRTNQNNIIKTYLDTYFHEDKIYDLNEVIGTSISIITYFVAPALLAMRLLFPHKTTHYTFKALNNISKKWQTTLKWLLKFGNKTRMRYSIIQNNTASCYKNCGVSKEDMTLSHYAGTSSETPLWGQLSNVERKKKGECLRDCFLENQIQAISLFMSNYFECLKKNGVNIKNAESDLLKFISRMEADHVCQDFHKHARSMFENFEMTLDMVFTSQENQQKQKWYNELKSNLYDERLKIERKRY